MNESVLKRALLKSLRHQGGLGFRMEDKYGVGRPDMFMHPTTLPVFLLEAKVMRAGLKLDCTEKQAIFLEEYTRPPHLLTALLGYHLIRERLFIGPPGAPIATCPSIARPARLDSTEWAIALLLREYVQRLGLTI